MPKRAGGLLLICSFLLRAADPEAVRQAERELFAARYDVFGRYIANLCVCSHYSVLAAAQTPASKRRGEAEALLAVCRPLGRNFPERRLNEVALPSATATGHGMGSPFPTTG